MGFITDNWTWDSGIFGGDDDAGDPAIEASTIAADAQTEALDYLKDVNAIPQQFKEGALGQLGGIYGLEGGTGSQQETIDAAMASPLYQAIMGGQEAGEESILRNAAATGGLRSGSTSYNLADYNAQLSNEALLQSYNDQISGLGGLAGTATNENTIAGLTGDIGTTLAAGITGAAQAESDAEQTTIGNATGLGTLLSGIAFSDRRLKDNITKVGERNGFNLYEWDWNETANEFGLNGHDNGVMADEVAAIMPDAVTTDRGYKKVNYSAIGISKEAV